MRKSLAAVAFSSALCLFLAPQANALEVITATLTGTGPFNPPPASDVVGTNSVYSYNFDSSSLTTFSDSHASFVGSNALVASGSLTNQYFQPTGDTTPYLAVKGGGTETITTGLGVIGHAFGLYVGSLDTYNEIKFYDASNNLLADLNGSQIGPGLLTTHPNQTGASSSYVEYTGFVIPFAKVVLGSNGQNSFEVDNIAIFDSASRTSAVPETSTWVMMIFGFLGVGFTAYRRRSSNNGMSMRWA